MSVSTLGFEDDFKVIRDIVDEMERQWLLTCTDSERERYQWLRHHGTLPVNAMRTIERGRGRSQPQPSQ